MRLEITSEQLTVVAERFTALCWMSVIACVVASDIQLFQATRQSLLGSIPYLRLQKSLLSCKTSTKQHKRKQSDPGVINVSYN
jgi:hypothetical protein